MHRQLLIFFFLISYILPASAQLPNPGRDTIRVSSFRLFRPISSEAGIFVDTTRKVNSEQLHQLPDLRPIPVSMSRKLSPRYVGKPCFLQFSILNDTDSSTSLYFLPGFYFNNINLYKWKDASGKFELVSSSTTGQTANRNVVRKLDLAAGEFAVFITELDFIKTTVNTITPTLTYDYFLPLLISQFQNERKLSSIITYLICGIMLMMIFYSLAAYYMNRNSAFLYYSAYAGLLGLMFFLKAYLFKRPIGSNFYFESYFDFIFQATGTIFYFIFLRRFVNARAEFPRLERVLYSIQLLTIGGMVLFTFFNFFTDQFRWQNLTENIIKYTWSFSTIFFIGYALMNRSPILRYLAIGHTFLFAGGLLSLFLINSSHRFADAITPLINDSLFWYEMGILFELVFFLVALSFKNRQDISARAREKERLLMEYEKGAMEKQMAILAAKQEERNRISADMHDELGSGVTAIRLMSELAKAKMKDNTLPEIDKISNSANDLISKMNTIIWTMKSSNDSVDNMIAYVRAYAAEFLDNTDIRCRVQYPDNLPSIELTGEKRRNIFLCIKESLNNIVKHARASEVLISFKIGPHLVIQIHDNGTGLQTDNMRQFSNGLTNMRKRMENIDGHFSIRTQDGTVVTLSIPLH